MKQTEVRTILLVEDQPLIAMAEKVSLEKAGYRVIVVSRGEDAVAVALNGEHIDLILMDIDLGSGIDGTEAAEAILAQRSLPLIFLSSHTEPEVVAKTEKITSYGYIAKSSGDQVIQASIKMAFRLHEANRRVRENEHNYQVLFDTITQGIIHQAADGRIISANSAAERIVGLSFDQMQGKTSMDPDWRMIREDESEVAGEDHPAMIALRTGATVGPVIRGVFHPQKQQYVWLRITATPLFQPGEQQPFQAYATFDDITNEMRATDRYRDLVEYLPGICYTFSSTRGAVYWSKQVYDILGYDPAEIQAQPFLWNHSIHPDDRAVAEAAIAQEAQGVGYSIEYRIRAKDGRWVWLKDRLIRKTSEGDEVLIDGFALDITRQKEVEGHVQRTGELNAAIIKAVPDLLFRFDLEGTYLDCFAATDELLAAKDLVGKTVHEVLPPELAERFFVCLEKVCAEQALQPLEYSLDVPAGQRRFEARFVPMEHEEVLAIVRDVTEEHQAREDVQRLLGEKETLLKEVHHRIKNNMNIMMGLLSMQAESLQDPSAVAALKDATSRFQSMAVLYDQLYRAEVQASGSIEEYLSPLLENLIRLFPPQSSVTTTMEFENCRVPATKLSDLGLIVNEVVTNAMKHAFRDHPDPQLTAKGWKQNGQYHLTITDNGPGIPEAFDPAQSHNVGMLVVLTLTEQLGGTIHFQRDNGTRVEIQFPLSI